MAFSPSYSPNSGDVMEASKVQGTFDELRVYLHQVESGAFDPGAWVGPEHIQPPRLLPWGGQEGVSGVIGGQYGGGFLAQPTFGSSSVVSISTDENGWAYLPLTSVEILNKRAGAVAKYAWWAEVWAGPDDATGGVVPGPFRRCLITPWAGDPGSMSGTGLGTRGAQEVWPNASWNTGSPRGPDKVYPRSGSAFMSGVHIETGLGVGRKHFGLAIRSENGRSVVVNFGFTLRVLWL